jgi:hypothetical protein
MSVPVCAYCAGPCDRRAHHFTIERVEGGRVVARVRMRRRVPDGRRGSPTRWQGAGGLRIEGIPD